jgi:hypothetical protein
MTNYGWATPLCWEESSKKKTRVTFDTVRRLALALANVEESTSYGTPALKVNGKLMVRLHEDGQTIVLPMPFENREQLMAEDPEKYFITDHYRNYEWVLVRLSQVSEDALRDLLQGAHRDAQTKRRRYEGGLQRPGQRVSRRAPIKPLHNPPGEHLSPGTQK